MSDLNTPNAFHFARDVYSNTGVKGLWVILLLITSSLTEGVSFLLLVPIITVLGPESNNGIAGFNGTWIYGAVEVFSALPMVYMLLAFVCVISFRAALVRWKDIKVSILIHDFVHQLQSSLFSSVAKARWSYLSTLRTADINHAILAEIDRVVGALTQLIFLTQTLIVLTVYAMVTVVVSPAMSVFGCVVGMAVLFAMTPIRRQARLYGLALSEKRVEQYRVIAEFLSGIKAAKAVNAEPMYVNMLEKSFDELKGSMRAFFRINTLGNLIFQIAAATSLAIFAYLALGPFGLGHGAAIALILVFVRAAPQIITLQTSWQNLNSNLPAIGSMYALKSSADINIDKGDNEQNWITPIISSIRFRDISFYYPGSSAPTLSGINFEIPVNAVTAIIGPSGSGKTTLADILMGLLEPKTGSILIDETELSSNNRRAWRDGISYVAQDSFLLHDTLKANLAFGRDNINEEEMWAAVKLVGADKFVKSLDDGLQTLVGDRGLRLSGGERQRITLARALLRKPQLLILDEATSALDWENQAIVASAIGALRGAMTIVTIAHRPSLISFADWVVAIDSGSVVEFGPYNEIAALPDSYLARVINSEG